MVLREEVEGERKEAGVSAEAAQRALWTSLEQEVINLVDNE